MEQINQDGAPQKIALSFMVVMKLIWAGYRILIWATLGKQGVLHDTYKLSWLIVGPARMQPFNFIEQRIWD